MLFAQQRVGCFEHETVDVMTLLKVSLLLRCLLLLKVWLDKCHLDIGELGVQVFGVHLWGKQSPLIKCKCAPCEGVRIAGEKDVIPKQPELSQ